MTIDEAMQIAIQHQREGRLGQAEVIYRQILAQIPGQPDVLHLLGLIAGRTGHYEAAVDLFRRALVGKPAWAEACSNLGAALIAMGKLDEALAAAEQAIALDPRYATAHINLGVALRDSGQPEAAIAACRRAIALDPRHAEAWFTMGNALLDQRNLPAADAAFRQAIARNPNHALAHCNLGIVLKEQLQVDDAMALCRRAIEIDPRCGEAYTMLSIRAVEQMKLDEAIALARTAIQLKPRYADAYVHFGVALRDTGNLTDAAAACQKALEISPGLAVARWNLALVRLLQGDLAGAWDDFESRWKCRSFTSPRRGFTQPLWNGEDLNGRTLLLHAEQGFGDTLQFIRYVPRVLAGGGKVILEVPPALYPLLKNLPGISQTIPLGGEIPPFDLQCPLMSLALVFKTAIDTIPNAVPYLHADPQLIENWNSAIEPGRDLKVGLVWAGSPTHRNDHFRSMEFRHLAPLSAVNGVRFFTLQLGPASAQIQTQPNALPLTDLTARLTDFAQTAALISNLDLVITVDTSLAHLAGARGKPVWLLLPFAPDWRWLRDRDDSPWYPTMRLFRQKQIGDWNEVVARVAENLKALAAIHTRI
jgi:tetratricopeptide (TPR) repeat protein